MTGKDREVQRVVVTVWRAGESRARDLEVPARVPAARLADLIATALFWQADPAGHPLRYEVETHPPGRFLPPGQTLAGAGIWDGACLVLHPVPVRGSQPPGFAHAPSGGQPRSDKASEVIQQEQEGFHGSH